MAVERIRPKAEPATAGRRLSGAPRRASRQQAAIRPVSETTAAGRKPDPGVATYGARRPERATLVATA
jgi:hypothetical protein